MERRIRIHWIDLLGIPAARPVEEELLDLPLHGNEEIGYIEKVAGVCLLLLDAEIMPGVGRRLSQHSFAFRKEAANPAGTKNLVP